MSSRIGVDIGGTFTDFILYDESGNTVTIDKIPTTPSSPEIAVVEVIKILAPAFAKIFAVAKSQPDWLPEPVITATLLVKSNNVSLHAIYNLNHLNKLEYGHKNE